jgi:hypothetical protein
MALVPIRRWLSNYRKCFSGRAFTRLTNVALELDKPDKGGIRIEYTPHNEVRRVYQDYGVQYEELESASYLNSGKGRTDYQQIEETRARIGLKMKDIRYGMSQYIYRKRHKEQEKWKRKLLRTK